MLNKQNLDKLKAYKAKRKSEPEFRSLPDEIISTFPIGTFYDTVVEGQQVTFAELVYYAQPKLQADGTIRHENREICLMVGSSSEDTVPVWKLPKSVFEGKPYFVQFYVKPYYPGIRFLLQNGHIWMAPGNAAIPE